MGEQTIKLKKYTCERCGYSWIPRKDLKPVNCPKCRSAYWDRPRIRDMEKDINEENMDNHATSMHKMTKKLHYCDINSQSDSKAQNE